MKAARMLTVMGAAIGLALAGLAGTAKARIVVDDFDSYVDNAALWSVWDDWYVNDSDGEIFLEKDPCGLGLTRDGNSVKFRYYNSSRMGPMYVGSWIDAQDMTELEVGSDWTAGGVETLNVYFRGDPCSEVSVGVDKSAARMWVELEDLSSNIGTVYYDDVNDMFEAGWHKWNIDLNIYDACGVTLSAIDRFTIGIGGAKAGQTKAMVDSGRIWLDDICLTAPTDYTYVYVDADATGVNDGTNWADAYKYLQDALADANSNPNIDEIRVAEGTYYPDATSANPAGGNRREATFRLINGVTIKGGYGGPVGGPKFRNVHYYPSVLSGDINVPDSNSDNSYHVVTGSGTEPNAVLDGFIITAGNANGSGADANGGGMYNDTGSPTVTNCMFSNNLAYCGGGMCNYSNSSPTVTNCTFSGNSATSSGGGIMNNLNSKPTVTNCIVWGNSPDQIDDYDYPSSSSAVTYSDVQGGWSGTGNIDADPCFVNAVGGDFRLGTYSPCVDAGNNAAVGVSTDLDGNPRFVDDTGVADTGSGTAPIVDMGAYERQVQPVGRSQTCLDHFWRFKKGNLAYANQAGFDDSGWRIVSVPHDWTIEDLTLENGPFNVSAIGHWDTGYTVGGTAWYRNTFSLDANDSNKIVHLQLDGVYMNSDVWVNGTHVGNRPYGYSTFWFDITGDVNFGGENVVAVEVKNEGKNTRWYSGSGIFRPVTLTIMETVHIEHWGPYITTPVVSTSSADVRVRTEVKNESDTNETVTLQSTILDSNGVAVATDSEIFSISSSASHEFDQTIAVTTPNLWSIDSPMLYTLSQHILVSGEIVDQVETTFGIRSISFDANDGFLLNGESVLLRGGCMHHDNYMLGSACYDRAEERRVEIMKAAGYNAIRTAHNPPSQAFLHVCDRLGVLVIDEAFDMWNYRKWDHDDDYSKYFQSWWQVDINSMVLRDRNHASIIMWSIGNEIPEQCEPDGNNTSDMLATYVRSLDPTRPVTLGANAYGESCDDYFATLDVVGYNYQLGHYIEEHNSAPERVMFVSETHPKDAFDYWKAVEDLSYVIGDFVWTGYDYLGEAGIGWTGYNYGGVGGALAPYPWHLAYCGDIDACGYKRPAAYYRDVLWKTGQNKVCAFVTSPTLSLPDYDPNWISEWIYPDIHPSWTWSGYEGTDLEVTVYSECDTVALFLNDVNLGARATSSDSNYTATWDVNYAAGELKAVGYDGNVPQAEWILDTAGAPASIELTADTNTIAADGSDLCYVTAELLDGSGNVVYDPNEDKLISFDINGPGKLAGVGNANPYGTESFQQPQRTTFRGRCVAVVKSTLRTGTITLTASSSGLTSDSVVIQTTGGVTSNTAPVANDDSYSVYRGEILDVWLHGVTSNDMDAELDPLSVVLVSDVSNGSLSLNSDGTFEYTSSAGFEGIDSFTYKANDGTDNSNVATVSISVESKVPPVGWWKFDDGSGTTAENSGSFGSSHDGTLTNMNNSDWVSGRIGGALEFDGIDDYVSIPALNLDSNTATISAWIKRYGTQEAPYTGIIMSRDTSTVAGISFGEGAKGAVNHELAYNWNDDPNCWDWHSGLIVPDSNWVFVALVVEPTKATMYMNEEGILSLSTNVNVLNHDIEEFDGVTRIGHEVHSPDRHFKGRIDDVRIYNYALSQERIEELAGPSKADFNWDGMVNLLDYAEFADLWLTSLGQPAFNDMYDLVDNDTIDMSDLRILLADWLWELGP
ncbi:MAG: DUF4982 domain-containing protein [Planctomycetota bacterium]|nr:MAG: DUF4982 domain-containing protein [Planctomycetota bacterium]